MRSSVLLALTLICLAAAVTAKGLPESVAATGPVPTAMVPASSGDADPRVAALRPTEQAALVRGDVAEVRRIEATIQSYYLENTPPAPSGRATFLSRPPEPGRFNGPDALIDVGLVAATAADYEMDGTMWVLVSRASDSTAHCYKSTDHGVTWQWVTGFQRSSQKAPFNQVGLVVGQGDSAFVYCYVIMPDNAGDLCQVRFNRDGTNGFSQMILAGPDTVNTFRVCRDYSGGNYWLYAVAGNGNPNPAWPRDDFFLRSFNCGKDYAVTDTFRFVSDGGLAAGAGSWIYMVSFPHGGGMVPGQFTPMRNRAYGAHGQWYGVQVTPDTFRIADPVIAPAFTMPETAATIWVAYAHDWLNSGDWDVYYVVSQDGGLTWSSPQALASGSDIDETSVDLRNYTSSGNGYVNVSFISSQAGEKIIYRQWAEASSPFSWSDSERVNHASTLVGHPYRPKLVYSPGSPGTGAGCVFVGPYGSGAYFNAPWMPGGVAEEPALPAGPRPVAITPNPCAGPVRFAWDGTVRRLSIFDRAGRLVRDLPVGNAAGCSWDLRDAAGRHVAPGVYVVRAEAAASSATGLLVAR